MRRFSIEELVILTHLSRAGFLRGEGVLPSAARSLRDMGFVRVAGFGLQEGEGGGIVFVLALTPAGTELLQNGLESN